jgi:hypothetical protein
MFKFKITLDRHNLGLNLNDDFLPDPPLFSLPSTFNVHLFSSMIDDRRGGGVWGDNKPV